MAQISNTLNVHPFDPITPTEVRWASKMLQGALPGVALRFKRIDMAEPLKKEVIPYIEAERLGQMPLKKPTRMLQAIFHRQDDWSFCKALLNVDTRCIVYVRQLPAGTQGPVDAEEMAAVEDACFQNPTVQAEVEKLRLPAGMKMACEPWMYGTDNPHETRRLFQCYLYVIAVDHPENNHYSVPVSFSPVFEAFTLKLVRMDYLPDGFDGRVVRETSPWKPVETVQYAHELLEEPVRQDLKPYMAIQPEGPSFRVMNNAVSWQKWRFRVGWNAREGLVLYNVTYDNKNVFYRLAVSEMTVPYGDPRPPYHRKQAFDVGDVGFGVTCNQLTLGCDCLGHIKYFDGCTNDTKGNPVVMKNIICMHEQDNGIQHKHLNYRTNKATVARNRQLVVQMICTLANYEYIFAWIFDQAAGIELEVRATGILSTMPIENDDGQRSEWGPNVGPGVFAPFHQHMFCMRVDPAIDGFNNTVYYEDSYSMIRNKDNPYGSGYRAEETVIKTSTPADTSVDRARVFKIRNDNVINPVTYKPVAYKLQAMPSQMLLMDEESYNYRRAKFATRPIWVTKYQEDELYAAGEFTNQSRQSNGVERWAQREDNVQNEDVVLWHTFGITHNPRIEDFPVMPMERISIMLKPDGFFTKSPALDVPRASQAFNRSTLHESESGRKIAMCCGGEGKSNL